MCQPVRIGVDSRSGSLGTRNFLDRVTAGYCQSAIIGIGGDPVSGTTFRDALEAFEADDRTDAIVLVGEIGGTKEEEAAELAAGMKKPITSFIAGGASPPGKKMGHAGAIVMGDKGTHADNAGNEEPWRIGYFADHERCRHHADPRQHAEYRGTQRDPRWGNSVSKISQPEPERRRQHHDPAGLGS